MTNGDANQTTPTSDLTVTQNTNTTGITNLPTPPPQNLNNPGTSATNPLPQNVKVPNVSMTTPVVPSSSNPTHYPLKNVRSGLDSVPNFNGKTNVKEFLSAVDVVGDLFGWPSDTKVAVAKVKLKGIAQDFLVNDPSLVTITRWEDFKNKLLTQFSPKITCYQATLKFNSLRQYVDESVNDFSLRLRKAGNDTLELTQDPTINQVLLNSYNNQLLTQFITGLVPSIRDKVIFRGVDSFSVALDVALEMEAHAKTWKREPVKIYRDQDQDYHPPRNTGNRESFGRFDNFNGGPFYERSNNRNYGRPNNFNRSPMEDRRNNGNFGRYNGYNNNVQDNNNNVLNILTAARFRAGKKSGMIFRQACSSVVCQ